MKHSFSLLACALAACGPMQFYRVRAEARFRDVTLADPAPRVEVRPVSLGRGLAVDKQTSGPRVAMFNAQWREVAAAIDAAMLEPHRAEVSFSRRDPAAAYILQAEVISVRSGEDMNQWTEGRWTQTCVMFTLWDRKSPRVLERFSVSGDVGGTWRSMDADRIIAEKAADYLAARFAGREIAVVETL